MNKSPYLNINRIEFVTTYQCSGKCKHCSVGKEINKSSHFKHIATKQASDAIKKLSQLFSVSSIMTFGGEPLLYPDVVCEIHETAALCGIGTRQLITNGYFSKNDERLMSDASLLKKSGVNNLLLSVDVFHQEIIPFEAVYSFAKCVKKVGIHGVQLHPAWVLNEEYYSHYNLITKEILARFTDLKIPVSNGNNIFMAGNAVEYLAEYYDKPQLDLSDSCGSMPYTEPLTNITSIQVIPDGNVMVCGFVIGNIYNESIEEIVSRYNPYDNECMSAIMTGGTSALIEFAERNRISIDYTKCYSICNICHKINNELSANNRTKC
ncbi:radical SAM protein [Alkaliphilus serpentinus]|nr:radical SAM protein [Alkaliphilus serpentinus]